MRVKKIVNFMRAHSLNFSRDDLIIIPIEEIIDDSPSQRFLCIKGTISLIIHLMRDFVFRFDLSFFLPADIIAKFMKLKAFY
jgi:hypothetical protein